ncbi:glycosyltransferase family 2 protein [Thorsellia kenyensis]|uniref:Glycosyltransferase family 2 protein n=1 Tax=Thorsellia kenyensis TaxID=1549888 RepID=A0ABV6C9I4_9GAMM
MKSNLISIVIASYNHSDYILDTLESALILQEDINCEIIIVDDFSSDDTIKIVKSYLNVNNHIDKVNIITKSSNVGLVNSLNIGLNHSNGEFIYFIGSDDIIIPSGLINLLNKIKSDNSTVAYIGNGFLYYGKNDEKKTIYKNEHKKFFSLSDNQIRKDIFCNYPQPLLLQTSIFRTKELKKISWDESIRLDDYPIFIRLMLKYSLEKGEIKFFESIYVAKYRQHPNNLHKNLSLILSMLEECLNAYSPKPNLKHNLVFLYAFYFLIGLRSLELKFSLLTLSKALKNNPVFFIGSVIRIIYKKIGKQ